jgi:hypothetical protein
VRRLRAILVMTLALVGALLPTPAPADPAQLRIALLGD